MCGIIGSFHTGPVKETVNEEVLEQFEDQKERGQNGFGIIKINDKLGYKVDRATEGYKFMWDIHQNPVRAMIVHHRIPTSTDNKMAQTHPILVDNGSLKFKYLIVHNGMIHNDDELKKEHEEKLGFIYATKTDKDKFNDSESLAIEVARFVEKQIDRLGIDGSAAFIGLQIDKKTDKVTKLFFGRNTNPLYMAKTRNKLFLSSAGKGDEVTPFLLYECKLDDTMKLSKRKMLFKHIETKPVITTYPTAQNGWTTQTKSKWDTRKDRYNEDKWTNYRPDHTVKREPISDIPYTNIEDEALANFKDEINEETDDEIVDAIELKSTEINEYLSGFVELLYDGINVENMDEADIDCTVTSVKDLLTELLNQAKEIHLKTNLALENKAQIEIGFTTK